MEDELVRMRSEDSVHRPVQGMESVVATVSGYHGLERLKLQKLINKAGGSYVGTLNQSTTHLVCRKFEGPKYELAKKLKTKIVNHRWLEDSIKQGKLLPEHPYTLRCGKKVGPLLLDIPEIANKPTPSIPRQFTARNDTTEPVIDITGEETENAEWVDSSILKENLFPDPERSKDSFSGSKRKLVKRSSMHDNSSRTRDCFKKPSLPRSKRWETKELSSPSPPPKKRTDTSAGTSRKGCRLVKKDIDSDPLEPFYASDLENDLIHIQHQHHENVAPSISSYSARNNEILRFTRASKGRSYYNRQTVDDCLDADEDIEDLNLNNGLPEDSLIRNPKNQCIAGDEEFNDKEPLTRLPTTTDLSCVICWTDFSSTRGVLPCGHRFCFPCIQNWADQMASCGKASTCPLCKASFVSITKVDDALTSDQKIYSQTVPHDPSNINVYIVPESERIIFRASTSMAPVCCECCCREPEDLLIRCEVCQIRCIHRYCLDPPVNPWTCIHCRDLQMIFHLR